MRRRHFAVSVVAILALGALLAPAGAGASDDFGVRFDKQVNKKLSKAGIINTATNPLHWTKLKGVPDVFADGADNGLTDINDCPPESAIRVIHADATVECEASSDGDITAVSATDGLTGGGLDGAVSLAADYTKVQKRVSGTCTGGTSVTAIAEAGTVTCSTGGGPLATGRILENGSAGTAGTANWTSAFATDHYEITVTGHNFSLTSYAAFVTPVFCTGVSAVTYRVDAITNTKVGVYFYKAVDQTAAQCQFMFQVLDI